MRAGILITCWIGVAGGLYAQKPSWSAQKDVIEPISNMVSEEEDKKTSTPSSAVSRPAISIFKNPLPSVPQSVPLDNEFPSSDMPVPSRPVHSTQREGPQH